MSQIINIKVHRSNLRTAILLLMIPFYYTCSQGDHGSSQDTQNTPEQVPLDYSDFEKTLFDSEGDNQIGIDGIGGENSKFDYAILVGNTNPPPKLVGTESILMAKQKLDTEKVKDKNINTDANEDNAIEDEQPIKVQNEKQSVAAENAAKKDGKDSRTPKLPDIAKKEDLGDKKDDLQEENEPELEDPENSNEEITAGKNIGEPKVSKRPNNELQTADAADLESCSVMKSRKWENLKISDHSYFSKVGSGGVFALKFVGHQVDTNVLFSYNILQTAASDDDLDSDQEQLNEQENSLYSINALCLIILAEQSNIKFVVNKLHLQEVVLAGNSLKSNIIIEVKEGSKLTSISVPEQKLGNDKGVYIVGDGEYDCESYRQKEANLPVKCGKEVDLDALLQVKK